MSRSSSSISLSRSERTYIITRIIKADLAANSHQRGSELLSIYKGFKDEELKALIVDLPEDSDDENDDDDWLVGRPQGNNNPSYKKSSDLRKLLIDDVRKWKANEEAIFDFPGHLYSDDQLNCIA